MQTISDFREVLKNELTQRMNRNPRYSLRAFAKDLKIAPPLLSDILNGKRGLSRTSAHRIAVQLGLTAAEREVFCDLVESRHARSRAAKTQASARLQSLVQNGRILKFLTLGNDEFSLVADWYHFAILELMKTPGFQDSAAWIARRLELKKAQVEQAFTRMERLGLLQTQEGRRRPATPNVATPDGVPSAALKAYHEQLMTKALHALHTHPLDERDFRGLTVRCRKSDLAHVRNRIRKFLHELDDELSAHPDGEEVFQLSTQFFRLTRPLTPEGEVP